MKNHPLRTWQQIIAVLMVMSLTLPGTVIPAFAAKDAAATKVKHTQLKYVVPGKRIALQAQITDPEGVKIARCYFKAVEEANFVFVPMTASGNTYSAVLPAPSDKATVLKYVFLSVNNRNQVVKTQEFDVPIDAGRKDETPGWQMEKDGKTLNVKVELDKAPRSVSGFSDSVHVDAVESALRFGVVVGLGAAAVSGTAGASSGSTVAASSMGMSTTAMWTTAAVVAGAAAVGGGVAAANSGGGGGTGYIPVNPGTGGNTDVTSKNVTICVVDSNSVQDDNYDLYVNSVRIGPVNNITGGSTCHNATLKSGANEILLRLTQTNCCNTFLEITVNPGGWSNSFGGTSDHSWTITAP